MIFNYRLLDVLELKQWGIFDLIYLYGIVLNFPKFEEGILDIGSNTLTISLLILDL